MRVPGKREVSEEELRRRVAALYGAERAGQVFAEWAKRERKGKCAAVEAEKERLKKRMHDLSQFCKTFKEAYTQDYNRRHGNTGTIWEGRFKSLLLEGSARALLTVAGYIHLNPVRAGMAEKAEKAENTGYGAACGGDARAREGLEGLVSRGQGKAVGTNVGWTIAKHVCRNTIEGKEGEGKFKAGWAGQTRKEASEGAGEGERGATDVLLRRRWVGFLHGGALGGADFVREVTEMLPPRVRKKSGGELDKCAGLGLSSAMGVREAG